MYTIYNSFLRIYPSCLSSVTYSAYDVAEYCESDSNDLNLSPFLFLFWEHLPTSNDEVLGVRG
jgi:hypothetical protein